MEIDPRILQFAGSLIAILVVGALVFALKLGRSTSLSTHTDAARAAAQVHDGYAANQSAISEAGNAAVLSDKAGQIMVIKAHGAHFAGRLLGAEASASVQGNVLSIATGEARFGTVSLTLTKADTGPDTWASAINQLGSPDHAQPA